MPSALSGLVQCGRWVLTGRLALRKGPGSQSRIEGVRSGEARSGASRLKPHEMQAGRLREVALKLVLASWVGGR